MRVCIDARGLETGYKAHYGRGTWRYATELINGLKEISRSEPSFALRVLDSRELSPGPILSTVLQMLPFGKVTVSNQVYLPFRLRMLARSGCDLFHFVAHGDSPSYFQPSTVVTVLDLIPQLFPEYYCKPGAGWRFAFARYLENRAAQSAAGVIAISEATKRDVNRLLGIPLDRIHVTPLGVSDRFASRLGNISGVDELEGLRRDSSRHFGLDERRPVLLYVGGLDRRKNVPFLLDVLEVLLSSGQEASDRPQLVLAGRFDDDDQFPIIKRLIASKNLSGDVRILSFVPDDDLVKLYWSASVLTFPSLYEGFGLPLLEAMACGIPVLAQSNSSLPEVCGESIPLIESFDVGLWVQRIKQLLRNGEEQVRLSSIGVSRAKTFSWKRTAVDTFEAYQAICSKEHRT